MSNIGNIFGISRNEGNKIRSNQNGINILYTNKGTKNGNSLIRESSTLINGNNIIPKGLVRL